MIVLAHPPAQQKSGPLCDTDFGGAARWCPTLTSPFLRRWGGDFADFGCANANPRPSRAWPGHRHGLVYMVWSLRLYMLFRPT
jgi:hypothetical protein